jgi:hypothetical protein
MPVDLLTDDEDNCIEMGQFRFVEDEETVAKGIIEIIYLLRNSLFHGTIVPDRETNKVYEPAYHVLHSLVQVL